MYKRDDRLRKNFIDLLGRCQAAGRGLYPRPFPILPLASVNTFTMQSPLFFFISNLFLFFFSSSFSYLYSSPPLYFSFRSIFLCLFVPYIFSSPYKNTREERMHTHDSSCKIQFTLYSFFFFPPFPVRIHHIMPAYIRPSGLLSSTSTPQ